MNSSSVVLITGTSTGFGRLTAETLARRGYHVFPTMREMAGRNRQASAELATLAKRERLALDVVDLDVTSDSSVAAAIDKVVAKAGRIDVAINNAGFGCAGMAEGFSSSQAQEIFNTNFFGPVRVNRAVLPHMRRRRRGLLMHISSGAGRGVLPGMSFYTASKFALEALAETYRYELSQLGIDSVVVEPGPYPTPVFNKFMFPADPNCASDYGDVAEVPGKIHSALSSVSSDPKEVVDAIVRLIEMPPGTRPLRTPVGSMVARLQALNETTDGMQREVLARFGLEHLVKTINNGQ